jgi:D-alanyl-D-alanine carboxypeptidase/D-alanyl-D-alanine-endopeptidase (penicillin-binding protein 4)
MPAAEYRSGDRHRPDARADTLGVLRCSYPPMARICLLLCVAAALLLPASPAAASPQTALKRTLAGAMSGAGGSAGAYVMDADTNATLFSWRADTPRSLASNTKLFTSSAVLGRYGPTGSLATELLGTGSLAADGTWQGNLYLRGGGDPTFGSRAFARRNYGSDASVEDLADKLYGAGFRAVTGSVVGDESLFDSLRGGPDSGYGTSIWVGPLSAIEFDRGLANSSGSAFQSNPPLFAATKLDAALRAKGIKVRHSPRAAPTPDGAVQLVEDRSPDVAHLLKLQNKDSDNLFAELLLKGLPVDAQPGGSLREPGSSAPVPPTPTSPQASAAELPPGQGTTKGGARSAAAYARSLGVRVTLVDGSGLSRSDRAAPHQLALLLDHMRDQPGFTALYDSLPIAGRDGTLSTRMRSGPARGHCHAKTGTLTGVSALSGYCTSRSRRTLVFSVLMNNANVYTARAVQDRVAQALAGYDG